MRSFSGAVKGLTVLALSGLLMVTTALPAYSADDAWGYTSTSKNADGSPNVSVATGWTNRGTPDRGSSIGTLSFTRNRIDYTTSVLVPTRRYFDLTSAPGLLVANSVASNGEEWTYVFNEGMGSTSDMWYTDSNGTSWIMILDPSSFSFWTKSQQGSLAVAVVGEVRLSQLSRTLKYTEILDITSDGRLIHHVTLTNTGASAINSIGFSALVDTMLNSNDSIPIHAGGQDSAYIENSDFRLYLDMLDGDQMLVGDWDIARENGRRGLPDFVSPNDVAPGTILINGTDTSAVYSTTPRSMGAGQSVTLAFQERLYSPSEIRTIAIKYVDDANGQVEVAAKPGAPTSITGIAGDEVGFTVDDAKAGVPAGYMYVSVDNIPKYETGPAQTIRVHVTPEITTNDLVTKRTITYTGAGSRTPADTIQEQAWVVTTNQSTGAKTYAAAKGYAEVTTQTVVGYTTSPTTIPATDPVSYSTVLPTNSTVRVTLTPIPQTINIKFVDDDAAGAEVTPRAGFATTLTGDPYDSVNFTEAMALGGVPDGYEFVSMNNFDAFDPAATQTITVHLKQGYSDNTMTTTRTITYTGAASRTPANDTQQITWDISTNNVTGVSTYSSAVGYPGLTTQTVVGYTSSPATIPATSATASTPTRPSDTTVNVTLTPIVQTIAVEFFDDDAAAAVTPVAGFNATLSGNPYDLVNFTEAMARAGVPAGYDFVLMNNFDFFDPAVTQIIVVHLAQGFSPSEMTTTRTITYTGAGSRTPATQTQELTWEISTNNITGASTYWSTKGYPALTTTVVAGYTTSPASIPATAATPVSSTRPSNTSVTVTLTPIPQSVDIVFVDDDAAGALVPPTAGFAATLTGNPYEAVGFTEAMAADGIPVGYRLNSIDNVDVYDTDGATNQTITVHLRHIHQGSTLDTSRLIHYAGAGVHTPTDVTQTLTWAVDTDLANGAITYTDTNGYPALPSPSVAGYSPDRAEVAAVAAAGLVLVKPVNSTVNVTYSPLAQYINVVYLDNDANGAVIPTKSGAPYRLTGFPYEAVNFTDADAKVEMARGFDLVSIDNVDAYDANTGVDQVIYVHMAHHHTIEWVITNRTVHYQGAGDLTPKDVVQQIEWLMDRDEVTGYTTYTADGIVAAVPSPDVAGFDVDIAEVEAMEFDDMEVAPANSRVTVTYTGIPVVETGGISLTWKAYIAGFVAWLTQIW
ncbi:MAG: hypothetical protein FWD55_04160 [Propionibacteriaceae bacterium]|nr:hypothetical protein [Propionibacteriaceae bacterium]